MDDITAATVRCVKTTKRGSRGPLYTAQGGEAGEAQAKGWGRGEGREAGGVGEG